MATRTPVEDEQPAHDECWCCGAAREPDEMVHLGNHPEVVLCVGCARWAAKQACEIEDRDRSGPLVIARDRFRDVRRAVVGRGWHRSRLIGAPLRWIGRRLP
jgi:hypothetical protein